MEAASGGVVGNELSGSLANSLNGLGELRFRRRRTEGLFEEPFFAFSAVFEGVVVDLEAFRNFWESDAVKSQARMASQSYLGGRPIMRGRV